MMVWIRGVEHVSQQRHHATFSVADLDHYCRTDVAGGASCE
ncbi:SAM-dependent DNA methyltransferase [Mycobacterium ahvazicum]|uniref:Uncharacterized protein n=2 Tax=Mycobacterium simiae complex TaxID=2249310 RepID=A0A024K7L2_9MYCO|nr:hypothetical protein BN973_05966 [Mycobacterium triplex]SOX57004.1 SAM-dependent DNA methyltransferase [Mycobacterium ahvazicum]